MAKMCQGCCAAVIHGTLFLVGFARSSRSPKAAEVNSKMKF